jgi:hypothetical protein
LRYALVFTKIQIEKLCELDVNKTNSANVMETIKEQIPSFNNAVDELNMTDKSKLQKLLQALGKLNSFEEARSSISGEL